MHHLVRAPQRKGWSCFFHPASAGGAFFASDPNAGGPGTGAGRGARALGPEGEGEVAAAASKPSTMPCVPKGMRGGAATHEYLPSAPNMQLVAFIVIRVAYLL